MSAPLQLVVLISGNGSNLQAIMDAISNGQLNARIALVISNRPQAAGLQRAEQAGIANRVIDHTDYASREAFDEALIRLIDSVNPNLIVLAGFMRILTDAFVTHYLGRLINIHPSLLPKYQGLNTHQRVLDAGDPEHGATVHYVVPELDSGPIILQARIPVLPGDDAGRLASRVHRAEHQLYPEALRRIAASQVSFSKGVVYFEKQPICPQQQQLPVHIQDE